MSSTSVIEISLAAIDHNMRVVRSLVGPAGRICPILKADAYGLGAARLARRLEQAGADMFAVYTPEQASELFASTVGISVLVLMPVRSISRADELYRAMICGRLHLTVHDMDHLEDLIGLTERFGVQINAHVEVDTGLHRGGCDPREAQTIIRRIVAEPRMRLAGLFTHFAAAERDMTLTNRQLEVFAPLEKLVPAECVTHVANTYALCRHRRFHKAMVRVGMAWAGYACEMMRGRPLMAEARDLRPSVTWSSRVIQVKDVPCGRGVGYGQVWTTKRDSRIALIPVGYADGYPYALGGTDDRKERARVAILVPDGDGVQRVYASVVAAVNMDQMMIDLTSVLRSHPHLAERIGVGTTVELITPDPEAPNHVTALAKRAGTLPHDLLSGLSPRIRREYVRETVPQVHTMREVAAVAG